MSILVNKELAMDIPVTQLPPGDPRLVEAIVGQLKSKGIFDQFRKECLADVDTKPAFQNLRQRVEGHVNKFLEKKIWKNDLNKNQLRDGVRKHVNNLGILDSGIDAIITQVVNPKIKPLILPYVEDTVYAFLQIDKPKRERKTSEPPINPMLQEEEQLPTPLEPMDVKKPSLLPMETDVISSEEDDILARESPDGDSKSSCSLEAEEVKTVDENAQDGFENCPPGPVDSPDAIAANVERLQLSEDDSKSVQATKQPLPLFDDQSLDSISSNSSGLTFSPLTVKGSPESKKSDDVGQADGSPRAEMRSATSTPLVDEKPVDESSQSSAGSNHGKEIEASEKHQGDNVPPEDPEISPPSLSALQSGARSGKEGTSLMSFDEDSLESKGSSKASLISGKSEIEEKIKSDKSEGEITSSSSDFSDGDIKGKQDHTTSEGKQPSDHDSSHKSSKSKSDHKRRGDSHSRDRDREREKEKESRHHREKERKHSKSRDDHHSHRDKDKKHHRRDKDHDGDRERSRSHHHQSSSSSSHKESSGTKDKERSSHHSGGKSSEGKNRSNHSSDKVEKSSSKLKKSDEKIDGKTHRKDDKPSQSSGKKHEVKLENKSEERSDKRMEKVDKKSEKKERSVERQRSKEEKPEGKKEKSKEKVDLKLESRGNSSSSGSESSSKENRENNSDKDSKKHKKRNNSITFDIHPGNDKTDENDKSCLKNNGVCESLDENCTIDPHVLGLNGDNIIVADDEGNFMVLTYDTDSDSMTSENQVAAKVDLDTILEEAPESVHEENINHFEGFENEKPKTYLADYLLNTVIVPDEMDMECNDWFDESDLHITVYENAWDGKVPLSDFLSCMHRLGAVIRNDQGEVEDHSSSATTYMPMPDIKENNNIQPIGKKRRVSNSSSISSSSSSTGSPKHKRFRRESSTTSETSQTLEQGAVIVSGYALLTPEDDGNRSMSREYGAIVDSSNNIVKATKKMNQKTDTSWPSKEVKFSA
ncbi:biorientation of chromosomes in cell division protein 1-like 1 isoform X2 [Palaemon carinicauda]|uniref:biorientation of chromosomes in cell division protein 1-like 1 isoform X2 n=1 Tax=Palaemon carinicauda TaxID=392227 RepID=UPI0035B6703F